MATWIAQKSSTAFHFSLRKNDILKIKKIYKEETLKALKRILIFK